MNKANCTSMDTPLGATYAATMAQGITQGASVFGGFVQRLVRFPLSALEVLLVWQERANQRHRLGQMDDRLLKDMGLSRADVEREAAIPFWRRS